MAQNSNHPADPRAVDPAWHDALAGIDLPTTGWMRIAARALIRLLSQPVSEKQVFRWSVAHWCRHRDALREMDDRPRLLDTANLSNDYPLIFTLVIYFKEANPAPLAMLLLRLVFELHLRDLHPATMLQVAETLRADGGQAHSTAGDTAWHAAF